MSTATPTAAELERRKSLRIRLRSDLNIEAHKYEGRTFYVVKDPVSLRYYRLKDNEHFLLKFLDGHHTLESAQKAYEREYRPERLKLEDLEGFAQQLLTAGLALSESPRAGQQLFERRGKRRRSEWMQTLTNILYIKIPIFDPERVLQRMLKYLGWIFSLWFFTLSCMFMASAVLLVLTHMDTFRSKWPDYQYFFRFETAMRLWLTLGVVKVIHEFGHGLSCKVFGGEVHEMGGLLLCFSPALYCNVSDAWILPNKWHRIIISFAGIYVELLIAAIATFLFMRDWFAIGLFLSMIGLGLLLLRQWRGILVLGFLTMLGFLASTYFPAEYVSNTSLHLMVVCSVSTIFFNANPLMRYDGYYVVADWLEIPNLREKSNRFLKNLVLDKCLGVEIPPEEYMELWRKCLFVGYAIVSYVYRWVVTFGILYLFFTFLRPYKLEIVGHALTLAAILSMTIWPVYRLFKGIYKRGRLPDMKRPRVIISVSVLVAALVLVMLIPLPISRITGKALVQPHPDATAMVVLKRTSILRQLKVQRGEHVRKGTVLAIFRDPDLEDQLITKQADYDNAQVQLELLQSQKKVTTDPRELSKIDEDIAAATGKRNTAQVDLLATKKIMDEELVLVAPRDGIVGIGPKVDEVGRLFQGVRQQAGDSVREAAREGAMDGPRQQVPPVFTIHDMEPTPDQPIRLRAWMPLSTSDYHRLRENLARLRKKNEANGTDERMKVSVRLMGLVDRPWEGTLAYVDESDMKAVPQLLSQGKGGPVPVKPAATRTGALVPQAQQYLAYIDLESNPALAVGEMTQVKIHMEYETCLQWAWRKVNDVFNLRLHLV
jgi:putative peptide zinc metalloprotease protein